MFVFVYYATMELLKVHPRSETPNVLPIAIEIEDIPGTSQVFAVLPLAGKELTPSPKKPILYSMDGTPTRYSFIGESVEYAHNEDLHPLEEVLLHMEDDMDDPHTTIWYWIGHSVAMFVAAFAMNVAWNWCWKQPVEYFHLARELVLLMCAYLFVFNKVYTYRLLPVYKSSIIIGWCVIGFGLAWIANTFPVS